MRSLLSALLILLFLDGCSKSGKTPCPILYDSDPIQYYPTYNTPVWHPNGEVLGFNYLPISGTKTEECTGTYPVYKTDSVGFYTINKDGSGLKRVTDYIIYEPAWSPDGKTLLFTRGGGLVSWPYTAAGFDTANKKVISTNFYDRHPTWTANSDSFYITSSSGSSSFNPVIAKFKADGTGKTIILAERGEQPFLGSDNFIYFINAEYQICKIDKEGGNKQILTPEKNAQRLFPQFYDGKLYYRNGNRVVILNGAELVSNAGEFAISSKGDIVYSKTEPGNTSKQNGAFWIMKADGSNNRQLTYNYY